MLSNLTIITDYGDSAVNSITNTVNAITTILRSLSRCLHAPIPYQSHSQLNLTLQSTPHTGELTLGSPCDPILKIQGGSIGLHTMVNIATSMTFLRPITSLVLHSTPQLQATHHHLRAWKELSQFNKLRTLRIIHSRPILLFETLFERAMRCIGVSRQASTYHIGPSGHGEQILPILERIEFVGVPFSPMPPLYAPEEINQQRENQVAKAPSLSDTPLQDLLLAFLKVVRQHPYSNPPQISISKCIGVHPAWIHELRRYTRVEWEEETRYETNHDVQKYSKTHWIPPEGVFANMVAGYDALEQDVRFKESSGSGSVS